MNQPNFFNQKRQLEKIIDSDRPVDERWREARELMTDPDIDREFWQAIKTPEWLDLLAMDGHFRDPPKSQILAEGRTQSPVWPASKYLARMAKVAPSKVAEIFKNVETNNASVAWDLFDAMSDMPADIAATLVPAMCKLIGAGLVKRTFKDPSDLCVKLAQGGHAQEALTLAKSIFAPRIVPGEETIRGGDSHWYLEGLAKIVPVIIDGNAAEFLPTLCTWLVAIVETKKYVDGASGKDFSYSWRPAIEENEQNQTYDFAGEVVTWVRYAFESAIRDEKISYDAALAILDGQAFTIFKRLRVHLTNEFAEKDTALARKVIMDRRVFSDHQFIHEYASLVSRRFLILESEERDIWFGWIDEGPDMSRFDEWIKSQWQREPTITDRQNRIRYWQFERLSWVRDYLENDRLKFFKRMLEEHGEPEMAVFNQIHKSGVGYESPLTVEQLQELPFAQALEKVCDWHPIKSELDAMTLEGLAATFRGYVASNGAELSIHAGLLKGKRAVFVRNFIDPMSDAAREGKNIDVLAILDLCLWVVEQPIGENTDAAQGTFSLVDYNWRWTRDAVIRFVSAICEAKANNRPLFAIEGLRDQIAELLEKLKADSDRSNIIDNAQAEDPRFKDYLDSAINSPRGNALYATLKYASWIAANNKELTGKEEALTDGFNSMPVVRRILEWHLEPSNGSFYAYAILGSNLGLLYWLDKEWLSKNSPRIFDLKSIEQNPNEAYGWAAWNAFLVWGRPHITFYELLKHQYAYAAEQKPQDGAPPSSDSKPTLRLVEHIMILYGRGQLSLEELQSFLINSSAQARAHGIQFVGYSLEREAKLTSDVLERFRKLWDWYWPTFGRKDLEAIKKTTGFSSWFICGQFSAEWTLKNLEDFIDVVPLPDRNESIVEQLATIAKADIDRAFAILDKMARADQDGWHVHGWSESALKILDLSLKANKATSRRSLELIDYLGRHGHEEFGKLLELAP